MFNTYELRQVLYLQLELNGRSNPDNINIAVQISRLNLEMHRIIKLLQC